MCVCGWVGESEGQQAGRRACMRMYCTCVCYLTCIGMAHELLLQIVMCQVIDISIVA